jgi:hypothetical protein
MYFDLGPFSLYDVILLILLLDDFPETRGSLFKPAPIDIGFMVVSHEAIGREVNRRLRKLD